MLNYSELGGSDFVKQLCSASRCVLSAPVKTLSNHRAVRVTLPVQRGISCSLSDGTEASILVHAVKCGLGWGLVLSFFPPNYTPSYCTVRYWHFPSFIISARKPVICIPLV